MKILFLSLALFTTFISYSQSWQWGRRAGSTWGLQFSNEEAPKGITSDQSGNVYIVSAVYPNTLPSVDTTHLPNYFTSNADNILVHSYSCDGSYRWSKIIGTSSGSYSKSIQTDTLGGVYVLAKIFTNGTPIHVSDDTSFVNGNNQLYVIKFDTAGQLQWIRSPLSDTISFLNAFYNANPIDMHVDKAGNVTLFTEMPPGNNLGGALVLTTPEPYAIHYDRSGTFVAATPIPFKITGLRATYRSSCYATVAPNGNYIFTGYRFLIPEDTLIAGTDTLLNQSSFVIVSSPDGQLLWYKQIHTSAPPELLQFSNSILLSRAATDENNNIYISGVAQPNDTLDGFVFVNTSNPAGSAMPLIAKFSASGDLSWAKVGSNNAIGLAYGVAYSNGKVAITGQYAAYNLTFPGSPLVLGQAPNEGRDPLLAIFDAPSGNLLSLDSIEGPFGYDECGYLITADTKDNFYLAGVFNPYLIINENTLQTAGDKDIFVAKYGTDDCDFFVPVATGEIGEEGTVVLSPNPAATEFRIQSTDFDIAQVRMYNLLGACVYEEKTDSQKSEITVDVSGLAKGVYVVALKDRTGNMIIRKVIVQ